MVNNQICAEDVITTLKELSKIINHESEKWDGVCLMASELLCVSEDTILEIIYEDTDTE